MTRTVTRLLTMLALVIGLARLSFAGNEEVRTFDVDPHWEKLEPALRAIPGLKVALQNTDYWVRQAASEVLAKLDKSHIHATQPGETDSAIVVRQQIALGFLVEVLRDHNPILRLAAAEALGRAADARLIPPLVPALVDGDPWVRHAAAHALEKLRWKPADKSEQALHQAALKLPSYPT